MARFIRSLHVIFITQNVSRDRHYFFSIRDTLFPFFAVQRDCTRVHQSRCAAGARSIMMIRNSFIHSTQSPGQKHIPRSREAMEYTYTAGLRAQAELADFETEELAKSAILETNLTIGLILETLLDIRDNLIDQTKRTP
jgi:hypothetical protein